MSGPRYLGVFAVPLGLLLLISILLLSSAGIQHVHAWVLCPECDPPVREPENLCDRCGASYLRGKPGVGLVFIAFEDKDRALVWAGPDTLCSMMSSEGFLAENPRRGERIPWTEVAFYLPQDGVLETKDGSIYESDHLRSGGDNPWCLRSPRLPARQLIRPWVDSEWIFTPDREMVTLDRARVLATSWMDLQRGKREWCRRRLGGRALHPFASQVDREELSRIPEPIHTVDPVVPDVPGSLIQGRVLLDVLVGEDGKPLCVVSLQPGSGRKSLQMAAIEAAYAWRFKPARKGRRALPAWIPVPFQFRSG